MRQMTACCLSIVALALTGCQHQWDGDAGRNTSLRTTSHLFVPDPNAPRQITYRIDDHRFVSLENYDRCYGDNYYNDTRLGIHQKVWTGSPKNYRGRLMIDDPTGSNIVLPTNDNSTCGERGCTEVLAYSTDSGHTFRWLNYMQYSSTPAEDSEKYTVVVTKDAFYLVKQQQYDASVTKYVLVKGINLNEPYPSGVYGDSFMASKRPNFLSGLHSPSGQERFTCDASIRPINHGITR
jgi:hypothetical protein